MFDIDGDLFKGFLEVIYVLAGFLGGKAFAWIAHKLKARLGISIQKSHEARLRLGEIRSLLHADRAMILQFHNGKEFVGEGRLHSYFVSCTFESTELGFSAEMQNLQNVPISMWSEILVKIMEHSNQEYFIIGHNKNKCHWTWADAKLTTLPTRWNISSGIVCRLKSSKEKIRGLVFFGFEVEIDLTDAILTNEIRSQLDVFMEDIKVKI